MNNWQYAAVAPTSPWRGAMTLPRSLSLLENQGTLTLAQQPVPALQGLRREEFHYAGGSEMDLNRELAAWPHRSQTFEMDVEIRPGSAQRITWSLLQGEHEETLVGFDAVKSELFVDRSKCADAQFTDKFPSRTVAPIKLDHGALRLHIFVDRSSVEIFAQDGTITMTNLVFPNATSTGLSLSTSGGKLESVRCSVWRLESAWTTG